jgi:hypothetical protein
LVDYIRRLLANPGSIQKDASSEQPPIGKSSVWLTRRRRDKGSVRPMPVYLSFLICALSGGACHVTIPAERAFVGLSTCQMQGMMITPQWQEQHPGWTVRRIRCSIGNRPHDEEAA